MTKLKPGIIDCDAPPDAVIEGVSLYARGSGRHRCYWPAPYQFTHQATFRIEAARGGGWSLVDQTEPERRMMFRTPLRGRVGITAAVIVAKARINLGRDHEDA